MWRVHLKLSSGEYFSGGTRTRYDEEIAKTIDEQYDELTIQVGQATTVSTAHQ
jgi:hypothetical protein